MLRHGAEGFTFPQKEVVLRVLRGGISKSVPCYCDHLLIYCAPYLSCNNFQLIHQLVALVTAETRSGEEGRNLARNVREFCLQESLFIPLGFLQHSVKSYDMGPTALLTLRRMSCYRLLSPIKIHRLQPGLNLRTLGTVASTITIIPARTTTETERSLHLIHLLKNDQEQ
jgi:hypothetical protein